MGGKEKKYISNVIFLFICKRKTISLEERVELKLHLAWYYNTKEKPRCDLVRCCVVFCSG